MRLLWLAIGHPPTQIAAITLWLPAARARAPCMHARHLQARSATPGLLLLPQLALLSHGQRAALSVHHPTPQALPAAAARPSGRTPRSLQSSSSMDDPIVLDDQPATAPPPPAAAAAAGRKKAGGGSRAKSTKGAAAAAAAVQCSFTEEERRKVNLDLIDWYDRVHRVLPWRRNPHSKLPPAASNPPSQQQQQEQKPGTASAATGGEESRPLPAPADLSPQAFAYRVWVSEIMLQQTQVATVIPYFNRWVSTWPDLPSLAAATQEEVNTAWAGLGYYRRARYLLEGARFVVDKLGGRFPETAAALRQVPGVGPYTAAAVASIAFNDPAAAVDGNVVRVLSRLQRLSDPKPGKVHDVLAAQLLHPERPGCHNQAMMEVGATVCRPANPDCGACPLAGVCGGRAAWAAYLEGGGDPEAPGAPRVTQYPGKAVKADKKEQHVAVCVVKVLLRPPPGTTLLPPAATTPPPTTGQKDAAAAAAGGSQGGGKKSAKQQQQKGGGGGASRSIQSFFNSSPAAVKANDNSKQQQQGKEGKVSADPHKQQQEEGKEEQEKPSLVCGETEAQLLAGGAQVYYLLTQRPEGGLLAGLWEFPSAVLPLPQQQQEEEEEGEGEAEEGDAAAAGAGGGGSSMRRRRKGSGSSDTSGARDQEQQQQEDAEQEGNVTEDAGPPSKKQKGGSAAAGAPQQQGAKKQEQKGAKKQQQAGSKSSSAAAAADSVFKGPAFQAQCQAAADAYLVDQLGVSLPGPHSNPAATAGGGPAAAAGGAATPSHSTPTTTAAAGGGLNDGGEEGVQLVRRSACGSTVHIFSHIRQTLHVELLVVTAASLQRVCPGAELPGAAADAAGGGEEAGSAPSAPAAAGGAADAQPQAAKGKAKGSSGSSKKRRASAAAADEEDAAAAAACGGSGPLSMRWVGGGELATQGLTAGVRKVLGLVKG